MKFSESKRLKEDKKTFNQDDGAEVGTYSMEYMENALAELLALQKIIETDIRNWKTKIKLREQGRDAPYTKYDLSKIV